MWTLPEGGAPDPTRRRESGAGCPGPPARVPGGPRVRVAHQVEPGFGPVGTAELRPPAPRGEGWRPVQRVLLLGGGVQRPLRVVEVRAAERAQVGRGRRAAASSRRPRRRWRRPRSPRRRDRVADPVGVRRLVRAPVRGPLVGDDLAGGHVDRVRRRARRRRGRSRPRRRRRCRPSPSRSPRCGRSSAARPATPRAPRRRPPAGSAAGSPASRRTRRCAGWSAATGTTTAGSRARSAVRAGRTRRRRPAARRPTNSLADRVQLGRGQLARHLVDRRGTAARTGRRPASCPSGSGSSMPSHISLVEPLRPECPSWRPIAAGVRVVHEVDDPRARPPRCASCPQAGAAGRDPALRRHAHHLGHHQRRRRRAPCRPGARGGSRRARRRSAEYMSIGETTTRLRSVRPRSRNGWNIGGRAPARRATRANHSSTAATNSGSRSRRLS